MSWIRLVTIVRLHSDLEKDENCPQVANSEFYNVLKIV